MKISQVLAGKQPKRALITVPSETPLCDAMATLCDHNIGALLVVEGTAKRLIGIVTDRDIFQFCRHNCASCGGVAQVPVRDLMTRDVILVHRDDDVQNAIGIMARRNIKHLPVAEKDGRVVDIVAMSDVLRALLEEDEIEIRQLGDYLGGTYGCRVY